MHADSIITVIGERQNWYGCIHNRSLAINFLQAVLSALFYGASYASFPPVTVYRFFDLDFSFTTSFPNGLFLHSGNSSRVR